MAKNSYKGIVELLAAKGIGSAKLAKIIGCSEVTAWRRLNDVGELRIKDIYRIMSAVHISKEEIRGAL